MDAPSLASSSSPATDATDDRAVGRGAPIIQLHEVEKVYRTGRVEYPALRGIDLEVAPGELIAIVGPSGSGKSTILNIITGIDRPTAGTVSITGRDLNDMDEEELAVWRGEHIGIVFQFFQLLPTLTARENVMLPLDFARLGSVSERADRAAARLTQVGLGDHLDQFPAELSGGEQQRVAIARALACDPSVLVADEPTGNLDSDTAGAMFSVLRDVNALGTTVVYVTHDATLANRAHRVVTIRDGRLIGDGG